MNFRTALSRKIIARITSSSIALSVLALPVAADVICNPQSDHTNVRQGPSAKNFEIAGVLQNGDAVTVLEHVTNSDGYPWIKIEAPGLQDTYVGYVTDGAVAPSCDSVQAGVRPPYGMCFYVMAARQSTAEVQEYIRDFDQRTNGQFEADWAVARAENGWYAITIGPVEKDDFDSTKERLISEGLSPDDAYCSDGKKYLEFVDIQAAESNNSAAQIMDSMLSDKVIALKEAWGGSIYDSSSFFGDTIETTYTLEATSHSKGRDACKIEISQNGTTTSNGGELIRRDEGRWEIDLLDNYNFSRTTEGKNIFGSIFSDVLSFESMAGVKVLKCKTTFSPGWSGKSMDCSGHVIVTGEFSGRLQPIKDRIYSIMNACLIRFGQ